MTPDTTALERHLLMVYERARWRRAFLACVPLLLLGAFGVFLGPRHAFDYAAAVLLLGLGIGYVWRGRAAERMVAPAVSFGLVPFVLVHLVSEPGSGCTHGAASTSCMLACVVGGVLATLLLGRFVRGTAESTRAFALGLPLVFLMGSLGCGCIGYQGVFALAVSMALSTTGGFILASARAKSP